MKKEKEKLYYIESNNKYVENWIHWGFKNQWFCLVAKGTRSIQA